MDCLYHAGNCKDKVTGQKQCQFPVLEKTHIIILPSRIRSVGFHCAGGDPAQLVVDVAHPSRAVGQHRHPVLDEESAQYY